MFKDKSEIDKEVFAFEQANKVFAPKGKTPISSDTITPEVNNLASDYIAGNPEMSLVDLETQLRLAKDSGDLDISVGTINSLIDQEEARRAEAALPETLRLRAVQLVEAAFNKSFFLPRGAELNNAKKKAKEEAKKLDTTPGVIQQIVDAIDALTLEDISI